MSVEKTLGENLDARLAELDERLRASASTGGQLAEELERVAKARQDGPGVYGEGVFPIASQVVLPRQVMALGVRGPASVNNPDPASWVMCHPSGGIKGKGRERTTLKFAPGITGALVKSELAGDPSGSLYWNRNNTLGDVSKKSTLRPCVEDVTIDGSVVMFSYPYSDQWADYTAGGKFVPVAAGVWLEGFGAHVDRVNLFRIPGDGIRLTCSEYRAQLGVLSAFDVARHRLFDCHVTNAYNGIVSRGDGDIKIRDCTISDVVKTGLIICGGNVSGCHIAGAIDSVVVESETHFSNNYFEAAMHAGFHVTAGGVNTTSTDHEIGPGTCHLYGALLEGSTRISNIHGGVKTGAIGVAMHSDWCRVSGALTLHKDATAVEIAGNHCSIDLDVSVAGAGTGVRVCRRRNVGTMLNHLDVGMTIWGNDAAGVLLDLRESGLDGGGTNNVFRLTVPGWTTTRKIVYPRGADVYNLAPGTKIFINGEQLK